MTALEHVVGDLRCPVCTGALTLDARRLGCGSGHSFDVARQGYVNLLTGRGGAGTGDSAAMVAARADVLDAGLLAPVVTAVTGAADARGGLVLDLAGGTGHYLAAVLDADPPARGLCLDSSPPALRRAARVHPRAAAVGADVWSALPLADGAVAVVLSVFGPRDAAELGRVLAPGGRIVVAAPAPEHLAELIDPLGMVRVDPHKQQRQAATFAAFTAAATQRVRYPLSLDRAAVTALVGMGPTGVHLSPEALARRVAGLAEPVDVHVAVDVTTYVR